MLEYLGQDLAAEEPFVVDSVKILVKEAPADIPIFEGCHYILKEGKTHL